MLLKRPETFRLNKFHPLAQGLVFAGLGAHAGSTRYHDSSVYGNTGTLTNMDPATDWVWDSTLNRIVTDYAAGSSQYMASAPNYNRVTWSCSGWWNGTASNAAVTLGGSTAIPDFGFFPSRFGSVQIYVADIYLGTSLASPSGWNHFCYVRQSNTAGTLYINNVAYTANPTTSAAHGTALYLAYSPIFGYWSGKLSDVCVWERTISISEIQQLADPSNVMLSGLIQNPQRKWWPVVAGGTPATFKTFWANQATQVAL